MQLTLAVITDIHNGPDRGTKKGTMALPLLERFRDFVEALRPDCTVDLGDRISEVNEEADRQHVTQVRSQFERIPGRRYHVLGNHDVAKLSLGENEELMQHSFAHHSLDMNGYHLVFWNANAKLHMSDGFSLAVSDLDWLRSDLEAAELPSLIFTHVPLDNGSMKGNFYFEKAYPQHAAYPEQQGEAIRDVIERSGKVILCLNGHAHWNAYHAIDGVHYVTLPSLTESFTTWPHANEAYARVVVGDCIEIEVLGRTPTTYRLPIRARGEHWVNIDKDYAPSSVRPA
ncbi:MAG TPA: hypothetical protein V6C81_21680 [Planktothrix sp.]|jgi:calcineurin-like phosphoesterase family protein